MSWYLTKHDYPYRITHQCSMSLKPQKSKKCPQCLRKVPASIYYFFIVDRGFDVCDRFDIPSRACDYRVSR